MSAWVVTCVFFFFFQAEDGIRDKLVTGVQTCALPISEATKPAPAKTPWKIVGQLEEACSCNAACPCWFGSKPTHMTCGGGQFIFIEKGTYGSVPLDGLAVGNMVEKIGRASCRERV